MKPLTFVICFDADGNPIFEGEDLPKGLIFESFRLDVVHHLVNNQVLILSDLFDADQNKIDSFWQLF